MSTEKKEKSFFERLQENVKKNLGDSRFSGIMSQVEAAGVSDWIKTPSYDLNRILSGDLNKGIPNRSVVGIVGPEHTMKSSFMVLCMAEAQKQGYRPIIIDTERGAETEFCKRWGLDVDNAYYDYMPWEHKVRAFLAQIKETGDSKLIIGIDSMGGLDRYKSYEDALKGDPKADQGQLQKNIRSLLKLLLNICIEQDSIGIVTGHMYGSPGVIPMPDQVGGGKAMRLFPSILISLKKTHIKDGKTIIGSEITATTIKNRLYPPFQEATVSIDYMKGIDPYAGLIPLLMRAEIIEKTGNTYSYKTDKIGVGEAQATAGIAKIPAILDDLNAWLKQTKYSSVNNEVALAVESEEAHEIVDESEENLRSTRRKSKK